MIELLVTSFPFVLRVLYLRWKGLPVTLYNTHVSVFIWLTLALALFFTAFYYHPKSYTGLVPFRTVPVVSENGGTVTSVDVANGMRVKPGQVLFTVDNTTETAAVKTAELKLAEIDKAFASAEAEVKSAQASVDRETAELEQAKAVFEDQEELRARKSAAYRERSYQRAEADMAAAEAKVAQTSALLDEAMLQLKDVLPAQRASAEAQLEQARVELKKTSVRSFVDGVVDQVTVNVGARASQIAVAPTMVITPDRTDDTPPRVVAGFSQVARSVLYTGMPAEVACDSNLNIAMKNAILPARIAAIQPDIAAGQLTPTGRLLQPAEFAERGEVVVLLEMVYPEHEATLMNGSGCLVQTYARDIGHGIYGHIVETLGLLKALLLRLKVWFALLAGIGLVGDTH